MAWNSHIPPAMRVREVGSILIVPFKGILTQPAIRLFREILQGLGKRYLYFVLSTLTLSAAYLLCPQYLLYVAQGFSAGAGRENLWGPLFWGIALSATILFSTFIIHWFQGAMRLEIETTLRRKVLRSLHDSPLAPLENVQKGDWFTRVTADLDQTEIFFTEQIPLQVRQVALLLGAGVLFLIHSGAWGLFPLLSAVLLAALNVAVQRRLTPVLAQLRRLHAGVLQLLFESFEGIKTIRSHSGEAYFERRFDQRLSRVTHTTQRSNRVVASLLSFNETVAQLLITATLAIVSYALKEGSLTVQDALFYPFFISHFYTATHTLAAGTYDWNRFFVEGGRLAELLFMVPQPPQKGIGIDEIPKEIRCERLVFPQIPDAPAISVTLTQGKIGLIRGPSGCGKSSLLNVLAGLSAIEGGNISFVTPKGDAVPYAPSFLPTALFAYVEQHPYLFEGTLRENLCFGNPHRLSDAVLWNMLERTSLFHKARELGGLEAQLPERGKALSVGERYRIALCRSLLLRRPYLLLDEPFASLDPTTCDQVVDAVLGEKTRAGIIIVSHWIPPTLKVDTLQDWGKSPIQTPTPLSPRTPPIAELGL